MGLVANSKALLQDFEDLDCCTIEQIQQNIREKSYILSNQSGEVLWVSPLTRLNLMLSEGQPIRNTTRHSSAVARYSSKRIDLTDHVDEDHREACKTSRVLLLDVASVHQHFHDLGCITGHSVQ